MTFSFVGTNDREHAAALTADNAHKCSHVSAGASSDVMRIFSQNSRAFDGIDDPAPSDRRSGYFTRSDRRFLR
jgi:hypothetical protein